jgi:hypothetical protein
VGTAIFFKIEAAERAGDAGIVADAQSARADRLDVLQNPIDARLFLQTFVADDIRRCTQNRLDQHVARQLACQPEGQIRADEEHKKFSPSYAIEKQLQQVPSWVGMPWAQARLELGSGRGGAERIALPTAPLPRRQYDRSIDPERVHQGKMRIGLRCG